MNDYQERKRRDRRVQYPPLSYWQQYEEMKREEKEFCRAVTKLMDKIMRPFLFIAPLLFAALITYHTEAYWIPPAGAALLVVWWLIWGRKRYE